MLDKNLIRTKIELIQDELAHLVELADFSFDEIAADFYKYNTMERLLEKIVIRAIDINQHLLLESSTYKMAVPRTYAETFMMLADLSVYSKDFAVEISKSVGTRNILVHEYDKTDQNQIYSSIGDCLRDYHKYCDYILKFVEKA